MLTVLSDRCPKCGRTISYTPDATKLLCPCGHSFLVVEFPSERLKMEQAKADWIKAQEALAAAEAEREALQTRLNGTLDALKAIEDARMAEGIKLDGILDSMEADRQTREALTELLRSIQQEQKSGQDVLSQLMSALMKEQTGAADKLATVQELSAHILDAQRSGAEAMEQMQDEILERIEKLTLKTRERVILSTRFIEWSRSMQETDVQRLQTLQSSSDTLLQGQKQLTEKLDGLSNTIANIRDAMNNGFDELRKQRLDTLIELYHQAIGLQLEREFDKAEEKYRELLIKGGPEAQEEEIYWRMLLCHYGVEYQEENGKTIPIILRPDLTDPSTMQVRKELFAHIREEHRAHYTERLEKIDYYLNRYREVRLNPAWTFDVFISVKQSDQGRYTEDSDRAADLYNYFIQDPALAAKKLRVFNSRYTRLPVGEEYEPYIIAALMSAKVLIVVGSTPEFMNSQWVKNEWSRFQYLQDDERKQGKTDRRLFCYLTGSMKPEKLPQALNPERQVLQEGPSMGNILRDIMNQVFPDQTPREQNAMPSAESPRQMADQMETWLELGMYQKVIEKEKSILDARPEILKAEPLLCLYALCAQKQVRTVDGLAATGEELREDALYSFTYKYADASLRARLDALWGRNVAASSSQTPIPPTPAPQTPESLGDYGNSVEMVDESEALQSKETTYQNAITQVFRRNYQKASKAFQALEDYRKSAASANKSTILQSSEGTYQNAIDLMNKGSYQEALSAFKALNNYRDSSAKARECATLQSKETAYQSANALWKKDEIEKAAITFGKLGDYKDAKACGLKLWENVARRHTISISAGDHHTAGLKSDGTVVAVGFNHDGRCKVHEWKDIVAVSAGGNNTIGLKSDGTVVAAGRNTDGQFNVTGGKWKNIVAISAGYYHAVGLRSDGTVVTAGDNDAGQCNVFGWKNIIAVSAVRHHTVGLKSDGTVVAVGENGDGQCDVFRWKDIVAISASSAHTVGLKSDGTVVAVGDNYAGQCNVSGWKDIVAIAAGSGHTVGLKSDGTVVAVGENYAGQCDVSGWRSGWKDIVAIAAGDDHTVGLKADGTVVAVGSYYGQCNVLTWKNIIAIAAVRHYTVGLKSDGTVMAEGRNDEGMCDVTAWKGIKLPPKPPIPPVRQ